MLALAGVTRELRAAASCAVGKPVDAIKWAITASSGAPTIVGSSTPAAYPSSYARGGWAIQYLPTAYVTYDASLTPVGVASNGKIQYQAKVRATGTVLPPFCTDGCLPGPVTAYIDVTNAGALSDGQIGEVPPGSINDIYVRTVWGGSSSFAHMKIQAPNKALNVTADFDKLCPGDYDIYATYVVGSTTETGRVKLDQVHTGTGKFTYHGGIAATSGAEPFTKDGVTYTFMKVIAIPTCLGGEPSGSGMNQNSVHFWANLGRTTADRSAGEIRLDADSISATIYSPRGLNLPRGIAAVAAIYDGDKPRQVMAPQTFADIVVIDSSTYEIRFYTPAQIGTQDETTQIYALTGSPFAVYKFENPDAAVPETKRLRITETRGASTKVSEFAYDSATSAWTFSQGNGLRQETSVTSIVSGDRVVTTTLKNDASQVSSKTQRRFHQFAWAEELISEVLDPDGAALTTTFEFYDTTTSDPNYGHLKQQTNADGSWVRYTYDAAGNTLKTIRPFLDTDPTTTNESLCRVTEATYDTIADADSDGVVEQRIRTIESTLGTETGRRYRIDWSKPVTLSGDSCTRRSDVVCTASGAAWDASSNLVTETLRYAGGDFIERERRVVRPDGTATLISYTIDAPRNETATVKTGQPNPGLTDIVDGTRTVTITSFAGQVTKETVTDIASGLEISNWTAGSFDSLNRPTQLNYTDGTYITRSYACCGLDSERDRLGIITTMQYDALGRQTVVTRDGISISTTYDADGRVKTVSRIGTDASTIVQETNVYDLAGRLTSRADALSRATTFAETFGGSPARLTRTTTNAGDGGTTIEVFARDGSRLGISGTAAAPHTFEYGVDTDGLFVKDIAVGESGGSPTTTEWTKVYTDFAGRPLKTVFPDAALSQSIYKSSGQLGRQIDPDGVVTLFDYNLRGELSAVAIDRNANNAIDENSTDRITRTTRSVASKTDGGTYTVQRVTTQVWETDNSTTATTVSVSEQSADGFRSWQTVRGLTTKSVTVLGTGGQRSVTITTPDGVKTIQAFTVDRITSSNVTTSADAPLAGTNYSYDAHHRLQSSEDARNGATTFAYFDDDQIHAITTPDPDSGRSGVGYDPQTTTYAYDSVGRVQTVTHPDGGVVTTTYYLTGATKRISGARTYPVEYSYDPQGRVKTLTTWQNFAGDSGKAVTTWNYDSQRGWLLNKQYADSTGPTYTYKASGRLQTRTWARTPAITTTYSYNSAGDLYNTDYSDTTPDVTIGFDRVGRPSTIADASGTRTLSYDASGQLKDESFTTGALNGLAVNRTFDALNRLSGIAVPSIVSATYAYDDASRLHTVTRDGNTATYAYLGNSALVGSVVFTEGATTRLTTTKVYDKLNRLTSIANQPSVGSASSYEYTYNSANQRTRATREDNRYWNYTYDSLGQVTDGSKFLEGGTAMKGFAYGYTYDDIGNWKTATTNGQVATYTPTLLNTYSQRTVPGVVDVVGAAHPDATVTVSVDGDTPIRTERQEEIFFKQLTADNSAAAQYPLLTITGIKNNVGVAAEDEMEQTAKAPHLAKNPEAFTYDADGNLTDDARWHYTWDGENRLIAMESHELTAPSHIRKQKLGFAYDALSRRFEKKTYFWNSSTESYAPADTIHFIYDGWNLLADLDGQSSNAPRCTYVWGLDLSGSLQGAGGVGGLLFAAFDAGGVNYAYGYDGSGNVTGLVDMTEGGQVVTYDYNAFGEPVLAEGLVAAGNAFRFSTKYTDEDTGFLYFGFRYYAPATGRWLGRDPIGERGGKNVFAYVDNDSLGRFDIFGLASVAAPPPFDPCNDPCGSLLKSIVELARHIRGRYNDMLLDRGGLYGGRYAGPQSWQGHQEQFTGRQNQLKNAIKEYNDRGCGATIGKQIPAFVYVESTRDAPDKPLRAQIGGFTNGINSIRISDKTLDKAEQGVLVVTAVASLVGSGGTTWPVVAAAFRTGTVVVSVAASAQ